MNAAEISFVVIVGVMVAFYVIFIRPARQEQRRVEDTIRDLRVGDNVVTTAGFFAQVMEIKTPEEGPVELMLDLGNGLEVRALTSAIARRASAEAEEPAGRPEKAKES